MVLTKTLTYEVLDIDGKPKPNSTISVAWKCSETGAKHLIHKTFVIQSAQRRQGTVSCKTRTEVTGGGKKPWKQKGTGRARSGSSNSPLWRGGGVAFGPKPKKFEKKINVKEKRLALSTALCSTANKTIVVDNLFTHMESPNTKLLKTKLKSLGIVDSTIRTLLITHQSTSHLNLSSRNIPNCQLFDYQTLNLKEVLLAQKIVITEEALTKINKS